VLHEQLVEVIDLEQDQGHFGAMAYRLRQTLLRTLQEGALVTESGEGSVAGLSLRMAVFL